MPTLNSHLINFLWWLVGFFIKIFSTVGKAGDKKFSDAMRHDNGIGFGLGFLDLYSQSRRQRCIWYRCSTIFFWHESHPKRDEEGIKKWSTFLSSSKDDLKDRKEKEEGPGEKSSITFSRQSLQKLPSQLCDDQNWKGLLMAPFPLGFLELFSRSE